MAITLKLGTLDLSAYARLNPDDGFDPYDSSGVQDPQWLESSSGEGQALTGVNVGNREMTWPLFLKAADKQALHDLVVSINRIIANTRPPLRTEWRDDGAAASTFHDVGFVRFDPDYNFRRAGKSVLAGHLRVFGKPPWGHTGTSRIVGTSLATAAHATVRMPSLAGDIGAQLVTSSAASYRAVASGGGIVTVLSKLPYGWEAFHGASLITQGTVTGASGAVASLISKTAIQANGGLDGMGPAVTVAAVNKVASGHDGRGRVLFHMRTAATAPWHFSLQQNGVTVAPTVVVPSGLVNSWNLLDLGVITVDFDRFDLEPSNTFPIEVNAAVASAGATRTIDADALIYVPEDDSAYIVERVVTPGTTAYNLRADSTKDKVMRLADLAVLGDYSTFVDNKRYGELPTVDPGASQGLFVAQLGLGSTPQNIPFSLVVSARERFSFAR